MSIIFINGANAIPILGLDPDKSMSLTVDNRYSSGSDSKTTSFYIHNTGDTTLYISTISATSLPTGVSAYISSKPYSIAPDSYDLVNVKISANSNANSGSQKVVITVASDGGTSNININLNMKVLIPAKLGNVGDKSTTILFNTPKKTTNSFTDTVYLNLKNIGDLKMNLNGISATNPGGNIVISITNPSSIAARKSDTAAIKITVPVNTPEKTYSSRVTVNAGSAGSDTINLNIKVEYGIDMDVSVTKINFGDSELYQRKRKTVTISEQLGYKSIQNIKTTATNKQWLTFTEITNVPAGGTKDVAIDLYFDGAAKPYKPYNWEYKISTSNAGTKKIPITTTMVLPVAPRLDELKKLKKMGGETNKIADNMYFALDFADEKIKTGEIGLDELITIISLTDSTIAVIESYSNAKPLIEQNNHDSAFEHLVKGSVGVKMISTYSESVTDKQIEDKINYINSNSHEMMETLIQTEAQYYESMISDNQNVDAQQKMTAYSRLSELWNLMGDSEKEIQYKNKADEQFQLHNDLVDSANNKRLESEQLIVGMKNTILSKWGSQYILLNPFNYDTYSNNYDAIIEDYTSAEEEYRLAGEVGMAEKTHVRFKYIEKIFSKISLIFHITSILYLLGFAGILTNSIKGLNSYKRDTNNVSLADYLIM